MYNIADSLKKDSVSSHPKVRMAISKEQFCAAKPRQHVLVDAYGRRWSILKRADYPDYPRVLAQCPGHEPEYLKFSELEGGIIDADHAALKELNTEGARIESSRLSRPE